VTPAQLQQLAQRPVCEPEEAFEALDIGRTLGYRLLREEGGRLTDGVVALRIGHRWKVPTRPILAVLGYVDKPATAEGEEA